MFNKVPKRFMTDILYMSGNYGVQLPFLRSYLSDCNGTITKPTKSRNDILSYQLCCAIYSQRHKRYIMNCSQNLFQISLIPLSFPTILAKTEDRGGPVRRSGGRLGRLDAVNEAGLFHKINKSKLEKIKKSLKDLPIEKKSTADPAKREEK